MKEVLEENKGFFLDFETFAEMKKALEGTFSSGAMVIIGNMAKPCGQRMCKQIMGKTRTKEEALNEFSERVNKQNWGELSFLDVDFKRGSGKALVKTPLKREKANLKIQVAIFSETSSRVSYPSCSPRMSW